jgi:predicted transposase/invertase (TIGR01784 family)
MKRWRALSRLKVKNDFIFQKIFGQNEHKEIPIGFLNAVFELGVDKKLEDIEILENTRLKKDSIDDKLTDVLEIHFLELPKFRKAKPDLSKPLDRWLIFIEDSPEEVRKMAINADPVIAKAEQILEHLGSLDEVRRYYEAREMAIHDEVTRITGARAEGRMEGRMEGIVDEKKEIARNMLLEGLAISLVVKMTGLSEAEIIKLQQELER